MSTGHHTIVQSKRRHSPRWLPALMRGAAGVLGAAGAGEQISAKMAEMQQYGVLLESGQSPVADFSRPHPELTASQQRANARSRLRHNLLDEIAYLTYA